MRRNPINGFYWVLSGGSTLALDRKFILLTATSAEPPHFRSGEAGSWTPDSKEHEIKDAVIGPSRIKGDRVDATGAN